MDFVLVTFGMKRKVRPSSSTLPVKVNCLGLRDPFHVKAMKELHPRDKRCEAYVRSTPEYDQFIELNLSKILASGAMNSGKPLRVGVFCGYGAHRSPTVAEDLANDLKTLGHRVRVVHW